MIYMTLHISGGGGGGGDGWVGVDPLCQLWSAHAKVNSSSSFNYLQN